MKRALSAIAAGLTLAAAAHAQPYGMGPGPFAGYGGHGGYGMGPGMMGGYAGRGAGPGAMWGHRGGYAGLDLSADQRKRIAQIEDESAQAQWQLMGSMHRQGPHMSGLWDGGEFDEQAARKAFQAMADARKAMFENALEARKRMDAVLTPEQREQLRRR